MSSESFNFDWGNIIFPVIAVVLFLIILFCSGCERVGEEVCGDYSDMRVELAIREYEVDRLKYENEELRKELGNQ